MSNGMIYKRKILILISAVILMFASAVQVSADDADVLKLKRNRDVNTSFYVENMFPGDVITKEYVVTSPEKGVDIYFEAEVTEGSNNMKLAEVLKVKVDLPDDETVLYDGLMRDMPEGVVYSLASDQDTLRYEITAYLDTSVDNPYMYQSLKADFKWWYDKQEESTSQPPSDKEEDTSDKDATSDKDTDSDEEKTGDDMNLIPFICIAVAALIIIIVLMASRRKREEE